jgi:predicted small secreted protein
MAKKHKESYFWTSYSDLMTNLFFVMLMLFILAIALLHREMVQIGKERDATKAEIEKINEIRNAIQNIDTTYFQYVPEYKKHILKTSVKFHTGSSNINDLDQATQTELLAIRDTIKSFLENLLEKDSEASYLLIIEGQASKDGYSLNNQLSYERALSLFKFWFPDQKSTTLSFFNMPCEVVIAGAGYMEGKPRDPDNILNQRFLIQIMPQSGIIE